MKNRAFASTLLAALLLACGDAESEPVVELPAPSPSRVDGASESSSGAGRRDPLAAWVARRAYCIKLESCGGETVDACAGAVGELAGCTQEESDTCVLFLGAGDAWFCGDAPPRICRACF